MINQSQARLKSWISGGVALGAMILWIAGLYIAGAEETSRAAPKPEKIVAAKVSRVRADLRAMATAVESYFVDHNQYPATTLDQAKGIDAAIMAKYPSGNWKVPTHLRGLKTNPPQAGDLFTLTTPISYITKYFPDPFAKETGRTYAYFSCKAKPITEKDGAPSGMKEGWIMWSAGPDGDYDLDWTKYNPALSDHANAFADMIYDPTNGIVSNGDISRIALGVQKTIEQQQQWSDEAQAKQCRENLLKLDGAKEQWAVENLKKPGELPTEEDLSKPTLAVPTTRYLNSMPKCPSGAGYRINAVGTNPECTSGLPGHKLGN